MKSPVYALWDALAEAGKSLADGFTIAAEILCPRDHTAEDRLRSWESAAVAVEDEICDEADACEATDETYSVEELFELRNRRYAASLQSSWRFAPDSAAVSAAADPSPTVPNAHSVVGGEGSGGASDILKSAPPERPQCGARYWCRDLYICSRPRGHAGDHGYAGPETCVRCGVSLGEAALVADGGGYWCSVTCSQLDTESDPGEVAAPSPGEQVRADDLAAHITATRLAWAEQEISDVDLTGAITRSLLADYRITKK